MRVRLRPAYSPEQLSRIYPVPHSHHHWPDHIERVRRTIEFARIFYPATPDGSRGIIADLSAGDAVIARALLPATLVLGDFAPGYEICGPIEETLEQVPRADLWLLNETIEHLDDPDTVLRAIRLRASKLVLSTPLGEIGSSNPEHYWGWDIYGVREMLVSAGWNPVMSEVIDHPLATYQLWGCK